MADNIEHQDKGELVANCDQLQNDEVVVTTPVESRIMSIRGKQIMIDRDLAELYGVETRVLNQAVKRNMERFPERFRFQLTKEEMNELVTNCDRFNSLKHSTYSLIVPEGGEQEQDWMWFAPFGDAFSLLLVVRRFHDLRSFHQRLLKVGPLRGPEVTCET